MPEEISGAVTQTSASSDPVEVVVSAHDPLSDDAAVEVKPEPREPKAAPTKAPVAAQQPEQPETDAPDEEGGEEETFVPDEGLLETAKQLKVSDEKMKSFKSELDALNYLQARADAFTELQLEQKPKQEEQRQAPRHFSPFELKLPEEVDPMLGEALKGIHGQMEMIKGVFGQFVEMSQQAAAIADEQRFDTVLNNLTEFAELVGKGSGAELKKSSPSLWKNRDQIRDTFMRLQQGANGTSYEDLVLSAVHATFPKKISEMTRRKIAGDASKRSAQRTSKPTSRMPVAVSSPEQAIANIQNRMAEIYSGQTATKEAYDPLA